MGGTAEVKVPASPAGGDGGAPPAPAAQVAPPAPESEGIKQLRTQYEQTKKQLESYSQLGKPEEITSWKEAHGRISGLRGEAVQLGNKLGYDEQQVDEAFNNDPVSTMAYLRREAAKSGGDGKGKDVDELVRRSLQEHLAPINEHINRQLADAANARFDQEFGRVLTTKFPDSKDWSADERELVYNAASELFKYDENALKALKFQGGVGAVEKYFDEAVAMLDKYYLARSQRESKRVAGPGAGAGGGKPPVAKTKGPTLDEIINDPGVIDKARGGTPRYSA